MSHPAPVAGPFWDGLADRAVSRAAEWANESAGAGDTSGPGIDPNEAGFTRKLLELLLGDDDAVSAALELKRLAPEAPGSMPAADRLLLRAGGAVSLGLPWAVVPMAKRWLRERLSGLVLSARSAAAVAEPLRRIAEQGAIGVLRPLGDRVHGPAGVEREVSRLVALAGQSAVSHLVVDPARLVPGGSDWSAAADVRDLVAALAPAMQAALEHDTTLHIAAPSVRWARLAPEIVEQITRDERFARLRLGVELLAELPETREFYSHISRLALQRVAAGGAPMEATIGVGGVAAAERVASVRAGLAVAVVEQPVQLASQLLAFAELALYPGRAAALRPVIATEDPLVAAAVAVAAEELGSSELFSLQLRSGVAPRLAAALAAAAGVPEVRVCLPVTSPREFGGTIDLLVPLAIEAAVAEPPVNGPRAQEQRAAAPLAAAAALTEPQLREAAASAVVEPHTTHRTQSRSREWDPSERDSALFYRSPDETSRFDTGGLTAAVLGLTRGETGAIELTEVEPARAIPVVSASGFANEPDTDASRAENREWARQLVAQARADVAEREDRSATLALSRADLDPSSSGLSALEASARWRGLNHGQRAIHLRRLALGAVAARDRLLRTLVADTGAPIGEIDREIGRIVDAARYTGQLAEGLGAVRGATFTPGTIVLVAADEWAGFAAQAEAVLEALGAGSGALWVAPPALAASARALLEEWEAAGLPTGSVVLEILLFEESLPEIAAAHEVDRAIVLGSRTRARALAKRRPDLIVEGRFLARGTIIVSPTAELARAVDDVVASALTGAPLSRAQSVVVVGSVGRLRRFRELLADALRAVRVGDTSHDTADFYDPDLPDAELDALSIALGPLAAEPSPAQLSALTELAAGERWIVTPERLGETGRLWSPGLRADVAPEAAFWEAAPGLPVIGLSHAHSLDDALRQQNGPGSGAVAGMQATSEREILTWLERAEAATLALNRATSDVRVERQPVGAWNDAVMGMPPLAAGPNRLVTLGFWRLRAGTPSSTLHLRGLAPEVVALIEVLQAEVGYEEFDALRRAALADSLTWRTDFAAGRDVPALGVERNVLRYRPTPTAVRLSEGASVAELGRVLAAALLVDAPISVSTGELLPAALTEFLEFRGIEVSLENDNDWLERIAVHGPVAEGVFAARVRLIGGDAVRTAEWLGGLDRVALWAQPVTMAGPVEILSLVREQSVTARAHRHGIAIPVPGL